jgi:adenosylmethionine-8-amino-7-oxononanoate aminotransferase
MPQPVQLRTQTEKVLDKALNRAREHELVDEVRNAGLLGGIQLSTSIDGEAVVDYGLDHGVILRLLRGNTVQISPPFIVEEEEIETIVNTILVGAEMQSKKGTVA